MNTSDCKTIIYAPNYFPGLAWVAPRCLTVHQNGKLISLTMKFIPLYFVLPLLAGD